MMEQRNRCDTCGRTFQLQIQLNLHKKKEHPEIIKAVVNSSETQSSSLKIDRSATTASLLKKRIPKSPKEIYKLLPPSFNTSSSIPLTIQANNFRLLDTSNVKLSNGICSKPPHHHPHIISLSHISNNNHRSSIGSRHGRQPPSPRKCRKSMPQKIFQELRKSQRFRTESSSSYNNGSSTCNGNKSRHVDSPNQKVPCLICKKILPNRNLLAIHLRKIHSAKDNNNISTLPTGAAVTTREVPSSLKKFLCKKCGKHFVSHHQRWKHQILICGLGTKYKCPVCPSQFRQFIDLCAHRSSFHNTRGQLKLKQTKSDQTSTSPTLKVDIDDGVGCKCKFTTCLKTFENKKKLCEHFEKSHNLFMCRQCPSILATKEKLLNHCDFKHSLNANTLTFKTTSFSPSASTGMKNEESNEVSSSRRSNNNVDVKQVSPHKESTKIGEETKSVILISKGLICKQCNLNFTKLGLYLKHHEEKHQNIDLAYRNGDDLFNSTDNCLMKNSSHSIRDQVLSFLEGTTITTVEMDIFKDDGERTPIRKYSEADTTSVSSSNEDMDETKKDRKKNTISSSPFKCGICSLEFPKEKTFFYHMSQQNCMSKYHLYTCDECDQGFTRETNLKQHIKTHHRKEGDDFASSEDYKDEESDEEQPRCKICQKIFSQQSTLNRHIRNLHPETSYEETLPELDRFSPQGERSPPSPPAPPRIPRLPTQPESFKRPLPAIKTNRKRSLTPDGDQEIKIGKTFSPSHLSFQQVHSTEKCSECAEVFRTSLELAQHLLVHNKAKASPKRKIGMSQIFLKCPICGLGGFKIRSDIVSHAKRKHTRIGQYSCPYNDCKVMSRTSVQVCDHVAKVHEVNKEVVLPPPPPARAVLNTTSNIVFPCMEIDCNESFGSVHELSDHLEDSHPGHKFYICSRRDCRIPFRSSKLLQKHTVEQHGKRK